MVTALAPHNFRQPRRTRPNKPQHPFILPEIVSLILELGTVVHKSAGWTLGSAEGGAAEAPSPSTLLRSEPVGRPDSQQQQLSWLSRLILAESILFVKKHRSGRGY